LSLRAGNGFYPVVTRPGFFVRCHDLAGWWCRRPGLEPGPIRRGPSV